ncbi:DUF3488 and transglutaminase-like domain-containing protein [Microbacterium invictum]|uniref:DUF3488 and transglutaminase-like domain-containing protein n=1 Tax=Microbacterium invictum TaxID=515415 RepID=A0ABZ0V8P4_9MICO|nr:DUF3488 and transglutaminase-like domain-containing protein [Microbacterium invictum]WQB70001.1 DUF3488 and transglutaminase-like domain-containing protein [Microbacterium invictum]
MSAVIAAHERAADTREDRSTDLPRLIAGGVFTLLMVLIAAVAAWPVYRSTSFILLVAVAASLAAGIAVLAQLRRWSGWLVAALLAGAFVVVGVPLAVPARLAGPAEFVRGLAELGAGVVVGWKDLVTVELPVGSYRNLLMPALVVFLVGTAAALRLSWRADRLAYAAVPVGLAMTGFGLLFGQPVVSAPLVFGPVTLTAPVETAVGALAVLAGILWLAWRTHDERIRALQRAALSSGVRITRRPSRSERRRTLLGAGMVVLALVIGAGVVPLLAPGGSRDVLRSAAGPDLDLSREVSPLAEYRALFADDRAGDVLFTVAAGGERTPDRVRLATLDTYDGEVFRSGADAASRFVRLPSALDPGAGTPARAEIEIGEWEGIWMPTLGRVATVRFDGDRADALTDRFYYNADLAAAVQTADGGFVPGDRYVVDGVEPAPPALSSLSAPGAPEDGAPAAPENLSRWVERHAVGEGGQALEGLVSLLRERGYLSHALEMGAQPPLWMSDLPDYRFQPSAAGHSLARIDDMFDTLLERESDPRAAETGNYVAAIGDDEQFAVAVALIARELGFPSRVVVGARLASPDTGVSVCDGGACRAQDISAWTEVQGEDGRWVPIDVTPQYAQSPSLEVTEQRDPENVTEVLPDPVEEVVPPDPTQEDSARDDTDEARDGLDLAWLWPILRITGLVLLILLLVLGPFLAIVLAKSLRRRGRRRRGDAATRVASGWDEYVDAAVDAGHAVPAALTRTEVAAALHAPVGRDLALAADRAVFSRADLSDAEAAEFWRGVDGERRRLRRERGFWRGLAATVSLRSFIRHLSPGGDSPRPVERGKRRGILPARATT